MRFPWSGFNFLPRVRRHRANPVDNGELYPIVAGTAQSKREAASAKARTEKVHSRNYK